MIKAIIAFQRIVSGVSGVYKKRNTLMFNLTEKLL